MDEPVERLLRFWNHRRNRKRRQKRISNLVANSNCIGTTAHLFSNEQPRAITGNLKVEKSPTAIGLRNYITKEIIPHMECIGTEASGNTATYGKKGDKVSMIRMDGGQQFYLFEREEG